MRRNFRFTGKRCSSSGTREIFSMKIGNRLSKILRRSAIYSAKRKKSSHLLLLLSKRRLRTVALSRRSTRSRAQMRRIRLLVKISCPLKMERKFPSPKMVQSKLQRRQRKLKLRPQRHHLQQPPSQQRLQESQDSASRYSKSTLSTLSSPLRKE